MDFKKSTIKIRTMSVLELVQLLFIFNLLHFFFIYIFYQIGSDLGI